MATNDKADRKADAAIFKSGTRRAIEKDLAKALNSEAWKDNTHKGHLSAVDEVHRLYKKAHGTK